ncbi:hypothetical protein FVE85_1989 [Porphyridium purpureum]|uniref:Uncharacterized protein n=1 Tax=Porphyridium purpureum TaxID=35688 RepID=A0A5J4YYP0_PORPP|nr:hypothetical protein FVE85_1989 [Porphyridium purpureum]|eukprot:POR6429..scf209_3
MPDRPKPARAHVPETDARETGHQSQGKQGVALPARPAVRETPNEFACSRAGSEDQQQHVLHAVDSTAAQNGTGLSSRADEDVQTGSKPQTMHGASPNKKPRSRRKTEQVSIDETTVRRKRTRIKVGEQAYHSQRTKSSVALSLCVRTYDSNEESSGESTKIGEGREDEAARYVKQLISASLL